MMDMNGKHKNSFQDSAMADDAFTNDSPTAATPAALQNKVEFGMHDEVYEIEKSEHKIFSELLELHGSEWREVTRWIKFEETVEEGGDRWSKPHVSTLALNALLELRARLSAGCIVLDVPDTTLGSIAVTLASKLVVGGLMDPKRARSFKELLLRRHVHQYELSNRFPFLLDAFTHERKQRDASVDDCDLTSSPPTSPTDRTASKIRTSRSLSRSLSRSYPNLFQPTDSEEELRIPKESRQNKGQFFLMQLLELGSVESEREHIKGNQNFMKKVPSGSEAASILVGEVGFLNKPVLALLRLQHASLLGDLVEVPIPVRFVFVLLGPRNPTIHYREMGRSFGALMADPDFQHVAYNASNREELMESVDLYLDKATVLPATVWDPNIRIEPPDSKDLVESQHEHESESDHGHNEGLVRTGRLFGGLVADVKRKLPFYLSDFKDGLHIQVVASFMFVYFTILAPVITFGGLLDEVTHGYLGAMENLLSGAICGSIYCLFAGQPLTIIGSTGPVLVLEGVVYRICKEAGLYYLSVRFWIGMWTVFMMFVLIATDASFLVTYITRFTEESFTMLIAVIYIYNAIVNIIDVYNDEDRISVFPEGPGMYCRCVPSQNVTDWEWVPDAVKHYHLAHDPSELHWLIPFKHLDPLHNNETIIDYHVDYLNIPLYNCDKFMGVLEGNSCYHMWDIFLMSLVLMLGTCLLAFTLKDFRNSRFLPSWARQLVGDFAVIISIVSMCAFDYLLGINTPKLNVPDKVQPTKEGRPWLVPPFNGNPWWTALITILPAALHCILLFMDQQITAVIVNRKEHKLQKGYGYHLDLFVLSILFAVCATFGLPYFVAGTVMCLNHIASLKVWEQAAPGENPSFTRCREQRVSGIMTYVLLGLSVTMTRVLQLIPMPVLYGIFLYMGFSSLKGVQLACFGVMWAVKLIKKLSIGFPLMLVVMVAVRKLIEMFIFTKDELGYLDDKMPEFTRRKHEDEKKMASQIKTRRTSLHIVSTGTGGEGDEQNNKPRSRFNSTNPPDSPTYKNGPTTRQSGDWQTYGTRTSQDKAETAPLMKEARRLNSFIDF